MKLFGWILVLLGIIAFFVSFSITGIVGLIVCVVSIIAVFIGILFAARSKKKQRRSYY